LKNGGRKPQWNTASEKQCWERLSVICIGKWQQKTVPEKMLNNGIRKTAYEMALENSAKKQHKKGIKTTATKNRVKKLWKMAWENGMGKWHGKMALKKRHQKAELEKTIPI
jgi:hypothetical protein